MLSYDTMGVSAANSLPKDLVIDWIVEDGSKVRTVTKGVEMARAAENSSIKVFIGCSSCNENSRQPKAVKITEVTNLNSYFR